MKIGIVGAIASALAVSGIKGTKGVIVVDEDAPAKPSDIDDVIPKGVHGFETDYLLGDPVIDRTLDGVYQVINVESNEIRLPSHYEGSGFNLFDLAKRQAKVRPIESSKPLTKRQKRRLKGKGISPMVVRGIEIDNELSAAGHTTRLGWQQDFHLNPQYNRGNGKRR